MSGGAIPYERIVAEDLNPGWSTVPVTMPAGGTAIGSQVNVQSFLGVPWLNAELYGLSVDADDNTPALTLAMAAAAATGTPYVVQLPAGTIKYGDTITLPTNVSLRGQGPSTVLKPSAALSGSCLVLGLGSAVERLLIDGSLTTGCVGLAVGVDSLVDNNFVRDIQIQHFTGTGAVGMDLARAVTFACYDSYFNGNAINLTTGGTSTPTNSIFVNCQFRTATTKGVSINRAFSLLFLSCLFESNGEEGLYFTNVGDTAIDIRVWGCWFENNWNSIALGAGRHVKYECFVDGVGAGTIRPELRSCYFNVGTTTARAIDFSNAIDFLIDHCKVSSEAGQIRIRNNSYGVFINWPGQNGAYVTTVDDTQAASINTESRLQTTVEADWADWTPVLTPSGAMTTSALTITRARYKSYGKSLKFQLTLSFTVGGTPSTIILCTLPSGFVVPADNGTYFISIGNDPSNNHGENYFARVIRATPAHLQVSRFDSGNWAVGLNAITVNGEIEIS